MPTLAANTQQYISLPKGFVVLARGVGTLQASLPAPQNLITTLSGQSTQTFGPFDRDVTVNLRGGPMAYGIVSDADSSSATTARLNLLVDTAELQALALANQLDQRTTYIDLATGNRYWSTTPNTFISAGGSLDSSAINYVQSGFLPPSSGTIAAATLAAGVAYIEGNRVALSATPLALTATRDNYIDLRRDGTVIVTPVTVAAAAPAIPVNSMRLGFVTTNATNVTARSIGAFDNQGNWMFNTSSKPACKLRNTGSFSGFSGAPVPVDFTLADVFDNANLHNPSSNSTRIVFPSPGLYALSCSIQFTGPVTAIGALELACYVSTLGAASAEDTTFPKDTRNPGSAGNLSMQTAGIVQAVAAGDYAEFFILPNGVTSSLVAAWLNCSKIT